MNKQIDDNLISKQNERNRSAILQPITSIVDYSKISCSYPLEVSLDGLLKMQWLVAYRSVDIWYMKGDRWSVQRCGPNDGRTYIHPIIFNLPPLTHKHTSFSSIFVQSSVSFFFSALSNLLNVRIFDDLLLLLIGKNIFK